MQYANNSAPIGSSYNPIAVGLWFFINNSLVVFQNNPLATLFFYNYFFPKRNDCFSRLNRFFRDLLWIVQIVALISFLTPLIWMIGVSVHGGLKPPVSPYPP